MFVRALTWSRRWRRRAFRAWTILQANRLPGQFPADRPADEAVLVEDADLRQVTWVVADDHLFADVGGEGQVEVAEPLEVDAILVHPTSPGHGEEQQIELLQGVGQPGQEPARLSPGLGRHTRLTVDPPVVVVQEEVREAGL